MACLTEKGFGFFEKGIFSCIYIAIIIDIYFYF